MSDTKQDDVTFNTLGDAIKYVEDRGAAAQQAGEGFAKAFMELTGFHPQKQVNSLDVVKICYSLFGEPKRD